MQLGKKSGVFFFFWRFVLSPSPVHILLFCFTVLGIELRASSILGK